MLVLAFGLLMAVVPSGCTSRPEVERVRTRPLEPTAEQAKAIAEIEKVGGHVELYEELPGGPVISVGFGNTRVTDAALERLKGLPQLTDLNLQNAQVTDSRLEHLKGFSLVTDAGLENLKGLSQLRVLSLGFTEIGDAGLEHLKDLTQLQDVWLDYTQVTDAGLEHL